jgi:ParB/RepB/Spo0J family partition protein
MQRRVDKMSVEYMELRDSIAQWGLIHPILVRPSLKFPAKFEAVVGCHRREAYIDLGLPTIPCTIRYSLTDDDVINLQIQEHAQRKEPTLLEYCRQLKKLMRPGMSQKEVSRLVHKEPRWVRNVLQMESLSEESIKVMDRGELSLNAGYYLARIPKDQQPRFLNLALTTNEANFIAASKDYVKKLRESIREGKIDCYYKQKFTPIAHLRNLKELNAELEDQKIGRIRATGLSSSDAWYDCLRWVIRLDEVSVNECELRHGENTKTHILRRDESCE